MAGGVNLDQYVLDLIYLFDEVLGLLLSQAQAKTKFEIPAEILKLVNLREIVRKQKNFPEADKLRKKIEKAGYILEDSASGPRIKPA